MAEYSRRPQRGELGAESRPGRFTPVVPADVAGRWSRWRGEGGPGHGDESGSAVVTGVVAIAILMVVFVGAANFVLDEYAKGALRTAVDEAAQTGATSGGSLSACLAEASQVRGDLLPGPFGARVSGAHGGRGGVAHYRRHFREAGANALVHEARRAWANFE